MKAHKLTDVHKRRMKDRAQDITLKYLQQKLSKIEINVEKEKEKKKRNYGCT